MNRSNTLFHFGHQGALTEGNKTLILKRCEESHCESKRRLLFCVLCAVHSFLLPLLFCFPLHPNPLCLSLEEAVSILPENISIKLSHTTLVHLLLYSSIQHFITILLVLQLNGYTIVLQVSGWSQEKLLSLMSE